MPAFFKQNAPALIEQPSSCRSVFWARFVFSPYNHAATRRGSVIPEPPRKDSFSRFCYMALDGVWRTEGGGRYTAKLFRVFFARPCFGLTRTMPLSEEESVIWALWNINMVGWILLHHEARATIDSDRPDNVRLFGQTRR